MSDTIGACMQCPSPLTTTRRGATGVAECGCPPPLVAEGDKCRSCAADEFPAADGRTCSRCPSNAVMQAGTAASAGGCACAAGFQLFDTYTAPPGNYTPPDAPRVCAPCPIGTFSAHASNRPCAACPVGSTTAGTGAERRSRCGERAALCLAGYSFAGQGLCRSDALLAAGV